ncbi:uncharacterized protein K452DRAFT_292329 [Aplosporella prunicola CBS 121167]|uniref:Major facilitator superfamily (MFS) profile domain-containing protein n=1 Tax=Aplosporella prunicola CBS 121167 TaxID=1176127 RepID=A0A6A6B174_9PEZI|nr:uncharacterized protein K452DRAFT_292329 [Aplosporella prunicola CBS 121167]KAF2136481.1 hypothetical protein K452DRAFT_292329 [Aplosporella prunicola CBS 121167]
MERISAGAAWLSSELGFQTALHAPRDVHIIFLTRFLRMFAYGSAALILALHFSALGISDTRIGLFMTLTLLGDVAISLLLTLVADGLGRRRILLFGCACMTLSGLVFTIWSNYWILLLAAIIGVISPSGNEIGPFRAVEESTLAHIVAEKERSDIFAWYVVLGTIGTASGFATCGWMVERLRVKQWDDVDAYRAAFCLYAAIGLIKAGLTLLLSPACEAQIENKKDTEEVGRHDEQQESLLQHGDNAEDEDESPPRSDPPRPTATKSKYKLAQLSPETRWVLFKLCALFFVDSLASGMVPHSLTNFYMDRKFHLPKSSLGTIMSVISFFSSTSTIFASAIAKRIGLVRTMAFTHLPSAIFLMLFPAPSTLWLSVVLLAARAALASMDQAPRSAFLSAVVLPEERTAVMGIVNVVKTLSQSGGPSLTGVLAGNGRFWVAFVMAGAMKTCYDIGLLTFFLGHDVSGRSKDRQDEQQGQELQSPRNSDVSLGSLTPPSEDLEEVGGKPGGGKVTL